jgi:hypothetical protein
MFIPNPKQDFFSIPDPGVKKAPDPDLQHCFKQEGNDSMQGN